MKPDEDMHAAVEEVDLDPCDLYIDLGTLIVEGRVPGLTDRGYGEGPHCPSPHGQNRHQCDPSSPHCQKYDQILKHMLLLWKNCIPMTIEVLLYPSCCTPSQNIESVPEMSYLLLEQWTIHMLPRRVPDASISPRGLVQAVRSFLYFSQLCAWFSLTGGRSPQNVHYRICVPGEAFSSKFSSQPNCHIFPVTNIGRNAAMKVMMKCHPRCGEIPLVPCLKHSQPLIKGKKCRGDNKNSESDEVRDYPFVDGILPRSVSSKTNSPADSMLGESLLDPPNSLCMYPKRYQSPSRCGSPSIEVPEHLMFGKSNLKREECPPRRSRPQRRPVVERFLKNYHRDEVVEPDTHRTYSKKIGSVSDMPVDALSLKSENVLSYCCIEEDMKHVSREEMEEVLERLRERQNGLKCSHCNNNNVLGDTRKDAAKKSISQLVEEMKINSHLEQSKECKKSLFSKSTDLLDSKTLFKQALRLNKDSSNSRKFDRTANSLSSFEKLSSVPETHPYRGDSLNGNHTSCNHSLANKLNRLQSSCYCLQNKNDSKPLCVPEPPSEFSNQKNSSHHAYQRDRSSPSYLHTRCGSVNIKKCGSLMINDRDDMNDEREVSTASPDSPFCDEVFPNPSIIPSAEKKALFRRSLDSATSLVFHQRSGLPLTSSPAPIRKSGTCFDFDSSLTSVSAIKRALFEKDPEEEDTAEKENSANLSNSAPASIVNSSLLGTFEESVLNGRLEPVSTVEGFTAEIGASGSFCPRHIILPVTVFFYTLQDMDKVTSPYMGHINLKNKDYHIPKRGTVQVTLFNPHRTVVKMFVVRYDLSDMPVNSQTFLRQRTLYMPTDASESDQDAQKWLRYLIHLRFMSSKSGRIYLHTDIRVIIFRKSDLDAATVHGQRPYELRSIIHGPLNPKFSSHTP